MGLVLGILLAGFSGSVLVAWYAVEYGNPYANPNPYGILFFGSSASIVLAGALWSCRDLARPIREGSLDRKSGCVRHLGRCGVLLIAVWIPAAVACVRYMKLADAGLGMYENEVMMGAVVYLELLFTIGTTLVTIGLLWWLGRSRRRPSPLSPEAG